MKMIWLIQRAEKKENSFSKRFSKTIEIPDHAQVNNELYTFSQTFLAKEPIYKLTLERNICKLSHVTMCVLFLLLHAVAHCICQITFTIS